MKGREHGNLKMKETRACVGRHRHPFAPAPPSSFPLLTYTETNRASKPQPTKVQERDDYLRYRKVG